MLNLPCLRVIQFNVIEIGSANQILQFAGAFPHVNTLRISSITNEGQPGSIDLASIQDFLARHQHDNIRIQELLVHNGQDLGDQVHELLSVLGSPPFELRLKRLGWTTISRTGRPTNWDANCPHIERIFHGSQPTLEHLHLGVEANDGRSSATAYGQ